MLIVISKNNSLISVFEAGLIIGLVLKQVGLDVRKTSSEQELLSFWLLKLFALIDYSTQVVEETETEVKLNGKLQIFATSLQSWSWSLSLWL